MAVLKFIQAQTFSLQSSGASSGDTTITLQSFKQIDGTTNILTADLGDKCYGTLEPNNGTQEEAISFTGVTQNASGTATLTGVKTVGFTSPYTETSGLAKSHSGGVTFILSNDAGFYGNILTYINTSLASGAALANSTTSGIAKLTVDPATGSNPIAVGSNDPTLLTQTQKNYVSSITNSGIAYATATGTATAYTATLASSISSLASGTSLNFQVPVSNGTGITLNINSLGAKPITKNYNVSLASGDLTVGQIAHVAYDGAEFQLLSPTVSALSNISSGQDTIDTSSASAKNIAHGLGVIPRFAKITAFFGGTSSANVAIATVSSYTTASGGLASVLYNANASSQFLIGTATNNRSYILTVSSTNITLTSAGTTGSPTGTGTLIWEAYA